MTARWRALWLVALLAMTACGTPQPSPDGSGQPVGDPPPSGAQGDGADCAPPAEPGPADEPDRGGGDLMDVTDYGGARWRLCLTGPVVAAVENSAWCLWSQDRQSVLEVWGHPTPIGAIDYDTRVALSLGEFQLGTTDRARGGLIATYVPGPIQPFGEAADEDRVGQLAFDVTLMIDPEAGRPEGAPPRQVGSMRWICGDPPPPA